MARFSAGARASSAGSATVPAGSLYASATVRAVLRECGVANTTVTGSFDAALYRLTTTGTQGTGLTEDPHWPTVAGGPAASCTAFNTHSVAPTLGNPVGYIWPIGAAVGSGIVWTFGDSGLIIPVGTANGIGILVPNGTPQIWTFWFCWDE